MSHEDDTCPGCGLPSDREHPPLSGCPVMLEIERAMPGPASRALTSATETKLRDVIEGALVDGDFDCIAERGLTDALASAIIRRLQSAPNIELDDGTLFVRRRYGQE